MSLRVLLVDDHAMLREGLRAILSRDPEISIVGESIDGDAAVADALRLRPDVVVMDIAMPRCNGVEATRAIRANAPSTAVVALSVHADRRYVDHMREAGASGYVLKEAASDELVAAIRAVARGEEFTGPSIDGESSPAALLPVGLEDGRPRLAPREREVLRHLAEGDTSRRIAELLSISPRTVETHRRNIMRKLGIHSIAALTKYAIRTGLTTVEN